MTFEDLKKQAQSARTLVELSTCIGKAVVQSDYQQHQADSLCSQYVERYDRQYNHVKLLGMSEPIELASIYTEVCVVPPTFLHGYRTQEELQELFLEKGRRLAGYDFCRTKPESALNVANKESHRFLNLLGAPGAGKSTFLRYIGRMALQRYRSGQNAKGTADPTAAHYRFNLVPVLLELRSLRSNSLDFAACIDEELCTNGFPRGFGRAALSVGGLLVLLDGLDEVPADKLDDTIQRIRKLVDQHSECRYITSCRTAFYKDYFPRFTDALLTDFTDKQIQNLIGNWFRSDRDQQLGTAATLWDLLIDPSHRATRELARTPLLATFLCVVYDDRQELPTNRAELYGEALRILLKGWAASKRVHGEPVFPGLSTKRELLMLEAIAGPSYKREQYFFTAQELATAIERFLEGDVESLGTVDGRKVVEEIEGKHGLLVLRAHDRYSFSHLTLHEYLAACHYYKAGRSREVVEETLIQERWREVRLLLAGLQEPDADDLLLAMATKTAQLVTLDSIKGLLFWAQRIVRVALPPKQTAARRALLMGFAFAFMGLDAPMELALDLASALDPTCARNLARGRDHARIRSIRLAARRNVALDLHDLHALGVAILGNKAIVTERSSGFVEACQTLERYLRRGEASEKVVRQGLENALEFPFIERELWYGDEQECIGLFTRTLHILECRDAAERVTQTGWDRVCDQLIAMPLYNSD